MPCCGGFFGRAAVREIVDRESVVWKLCLGLGTAFAFWLAHFSVNDGLPAEFSVRNINLPRFKAALRQNRPVDSLILKKMNLSSRDIDRLTEE